MSFPTRSEGGFHCCRASAIMIQGAETAVGDGRK